MEMLINLIPLTAMGIPIFFIWERIFIKKIADRKQRRRNIWIATLITTPIIYFFIVLIFFFIITRNQEF
jgi:uncharacterized membrane protein